jgi:hypothetical protein
MPKGEWGAAEAEGSRVQGQPGICSQTLSQNKTPTEKNNVQKGKLNHKAKLKEKRQT